MSKKTEAAVVRCRSIGPKPELFRCGLPAGNDGDHSALIPTGAPWFGSAHAKATKGKRK